MTLTLRMNVVLIYLIAFCVFICIYWLCGADKANDYEKHIKKVICLLIIVLNV